MNKYHLLSKMFDKNIVKTGSFTLKSGKTSSIYINFERADIISRHIGVNSNIIKARL